MIFRGEPEPQYERRRDGVTVLSMAPPMLPKIRAVVRQTSLARTQRLAEEALRQTDPAAVRAILAR